MRHRVHFAFPKPKTPMALGADGIDKGTEATQARVIPRYRSRLEKMEIKPN